MSKSFSLGRILVIVVILIVFSSIATVFGQIFLVPIFVIVAVIGVYTVGGSIGTRR